MSQMYKNYCWVLQLFGIACLKTGVRPEKIVDPAILAECSVPHREAGIFYDGVCFLFVLMQRRIFGSEYFKHVVAEIRAQKFIASRGAEIIAKITKKQVEEAERKEDEILSKVKKKMDRIQLLKLSDAEIERERELSQLSLQEDDDYDEGSMRSPRVSITLSSDASNLPRPGKLIFPPTKEDESDYSHKDASMPTVGPALKRSSGSASHMPFFTPTESVSVQITGEDWRPRLLRKRTQSASDSKVPLRTESMSPTQKHKIRFATRTMTESRDNGEFDSGDEW
ncbi:unnamed protein product [Toxocara canis]|uniref:PIEZO domain-containing protein n=1 Tax=Toxocara canis TaxID=6265 RepID=A0A183VBJ0_TOXCA|nr:unnamed protein product [Toxocara canis]